MKKLLILFLILSLFATLTVGCVNNGNDGEGSSEGSGESGGESGGEGSGESGGESGGDEVPGGEGYYDHGGWTEPQK